MTSPTNRDLQVMLARIEERQINVVEKMADFKTSHEKHLIDDAKEFKDLGDKISSMNRYAASIAGVAAFIGAGVTAGIDWLRR